MEREKISYQKVHLLIADFLALILSSIDKARFFSAFIEELTKNCGICKENRGLSKGVPFESGKEQMKQTERKPHSERRRK